ncbi:MAG: hypothetical protein OEY56_12920, partial [Cyclobacteriaceae bacterium]|nr:hypothetical protein [Cyclobacteriaceae bacterium]
MKATCAQELVVELSIEWRQVRSMADIPPVVPDSLMVRPFMHFVYRNYTGEDIYIMNVHESSKYPFMSSVSNVYNLNDLADRVRKNPDHSNRS